MSQSTWAAASVHPLDAGFNRPAATRLIAEDAAGSSAGTSRHKQKSSDAAGKSKAQAGALLFLSARIGWWRRAAQIIAPFVAPSAVPAPAFDDAAPICQVATTSRA